MNIAQYIDHTLLKPDATEKQIIQLCEEAKQYGFYSVCVNPTWVSLCHEILADSNEKVCSVVGFPLGANLSGIKATEARFAVDQGADEIDMVINIGKLKSGDWLYCLRDIETVRMAIDSNLFGIILKVIIEACLLNEKEKKRACKIADGAGADYVKTSTGFSKYGARVEDVRLMRQTVGNRLGVKAAGGIKTYADAKAMIEAGANRLGCSNSIAIVCEAMEAEKK